MFIWIQTILLSAAYLRASFYSVVFIVAVAEFEQAVSSICQHIIINVLWKAWSGRCIPDLWIEMNWWGSSFHLLETTIIHLKWVSYFCCCTQTARNCLIVLYLIELLCLKIMLDLAVYTWRNHRQGNRQENCDSRWWYQHQLFITCVFIRCFLLFIGKHAERTDQHGFVSREWVLSDWCIPFHEFWNYVTNCFWLDFDAESCFLKVSNRILWLLPSLKLVSLQSSLLSWHWKVYAKLFTSYKYNVISLYIL